MSGQGRNTTVQVWTVVEGFGIGSEFRKTRCAANNLRDHKLDSVKAISIHRAHQLLPELNRILFRSRLHDAVIRVYAPEESRTVGVWEAGIALGKRIVSRCPEATDLSGRFQRRVR